MIIINNIFHEHKYKIILFIFLLSIFLLRIFIYYQNYLDFKKEELLSKKALVLNIYNKKEFNILKLQNKEFSFFISVHKEFQIKKYEKIELSLLSKNISFINYLKGFYTKAILYEKIEKKESLKDKSFFFINNQHKNIKNQELFSALFLAIPLSKELKEFFSTLGISHLIALSGFHLAVISFCIYYFFYSFYKYFQERYFPYRNRRFDLLVIVGIILFLYLNFVSYVPSLLRAFIMFIFAIYLLRSNIKLFSFINLFFTLMIILALFPKYLFSLGLWFSIFGVFYIFLYIQYFKNIKSKILHLIFFNFWIYFALNPIIHYFFPVTAYEQLFSPILTILFTIFYPLELFLHLISYGYLFDFFLDKFFIMNIYTYEVKTDFIFLCIYMSFSFLAIKSKKAFYLLNIFMLLFLFELFL